MSRQSSFATTYCALVCIFSLGTAIPAYAQSQLTFVPYHQTGIYERGEVAGWHVSPAADATCFRYSYTVKKNDKDIIRTGQLDLSIKPMDIEVQIDEPAMILIEVIAECQSGSPSDATKAVKNNAPAVSNQVDPGQHADPEAVLGAAIAPTLLKPSVSRPSDFDAFWAEKLATLAKIPMNPELTRAANDDASVDLFTVKLDSVGSHVQGYLARPVKPGKYPALIIYQYAGVYKLKPAETVKHAKDGWLTFDVDSHDIPPTTDTGVPTNYYTIGNRDREQSYFLDMYLRDRRAIDYIASRPDWDRKTIVLIGTSMGGQQSLVSAALSPDRITAVIVNEPAGADTNGDLHGRKAGYPYWPSDDLESMETSLYFDPVNFAPLITAPTIIGVGFIDTTAPPAGLWTVFNQLGGPKEMVPMIESAHNNKTPDKQGAFIKRSGDALKALLHGEGLDMTK